MENETDIREAAESYALKGVFSIMHHHRQDVDNSMFTHFIAGAQWYQNYIKDVLDSHKELVKELDIILNGNNAAENPSLCDLISQVKDQEKHIIEVIRQVLYYGNPNYYEGGGCTGAINFPPGGTTKKAKEYYERFYLKK